jgi:hypothetical protein
MAPGGSGLVSPVTATIRQIGYEALVSFAASHPAALADPQLVSYYRQLHSATEA